MTARIFLSGVPGYSANLHITDANHNDLLVIPILPPDWGEYWVDVDLSSYDIAVSGDFYIAMEFTTYCSPSLGVDSSGPVDGRSHWYEPGTGWVQDLNYDYMIRVEIVEVPAAGVPELGTPMALMVSVSMVALFLLRRIRLKHNSP